MNSMKGESILNIYLNQFPFCTQMHKFVVICTFLKKYAFHLSYLVHSTKVVFISKPTQIYQHQSYLLFTTYLSLKISTYI